MRGSRKAIKPRPTVALDQQFAIRLMEHLVVATFVLDSESRVLVWNKACERLTGFRSEDMVHTSDHWRAFYAEKRPCLADLVIQGDYASIRTMYDTCGPLGLSDIGVSVEHWCLLPKLSRRACLAFDAGPIYDEHGRLIAVVETIRDITAHQEARQALETLAAKDGLTDLANRRGFDDVLASETRRAAHNLEPLSIVMIDIDCFKAYNDALGHQSGDECIKAVAGAIVNAVRPGDLAARYGGEEFALILSRTDAERSALIAERVRAAVEGLHIVHPASLAGGTVTVSVGAATSWGADLDSSRLLQSADAALYLSKRNGRNRVTIAEGQEALELF